MVYAPPPPDLIFISFVLANRVHLSEAKPDQQHKEKKSLNVLINSAKVYTDLCDVINKFAASKN